ncbi:helix-turn-helix domain-containing protein [Streptomyces griseofuscus]|uniref:helix-turn-helix domain-containing protein n=1 Tax=Streptomyces griseofuscus TaxID=146922 RepID=UPI00381A0B01
MTSRSPWTSSPAAPASAPAHSCACGARRRATPHQWVLTVRIDHARELLEATTLSVEQIADQTGLGSSTNFRARFRDSLDTTPTAYRRMCQRSGAGG